jgi:hypothetical protein
LILEEKLALGLAIPPPDTAPLELLSEEGLVQRALEARRAGGGSRRREVEAELRRSRAGPTSGKLWRNAWSGARTAACS